MSNLSETSIDIIISYLKPVEKKDISKKYRKEVIYQSKEKIANCVCKWLDSYKNYMDFNYYNIPRIVYKKHYPMIYRNAFIESALDETTDTEKYEQIMNIINSDNISSKSIKFNKIIDILSDEDLFSIGW